MTTLSLQTIYEGIICQIFVTPNKDIIIQDMSTDDCIITIPKDDWTAVKEFIDSQMVGK